MKKLLVALFAAALVSLGLVGFSSSPASAVGCDSEYPGDCPRTRVIAGDKTVKKGDSTRIPVTVKAKASTRTPKGTVKVTCSKGASTKSGSATLRGGDARVLVGPFGKRGQWDCTVRYISNGAFHNSTGSATVTVIRRG